MAHQPRPQADRSGGRRTGRALPADGDAPVGHPVELHRTPSSWRGCPRWWRGAGRLWPARQAPLWRDVTQFAKVSFPAVAYRMRWWWIGCAVLGNLVALALAIWLVHSPEVQAGLGTPDEIRDLVEHDFANYYTEHSASSFAFQVWVNNAWVSAVALIFGILLGIPDRVRAAAQPGQPRPDRRPDVRLRQGRRLLRPDPPARPAGADRRVPGLRRGTETRLDDHRSGAAPPQPGARRGGPRRRQHRPRPRRGAAGVRPHRGLRHRLGAHHVAAHLHRGRRPRPRSSPTSSSWGAAPPGRA